MPLPIVALPCGSRSTSRTRWPSAARPAARLTLVVVLPTPPFWFATQKIFAIVGVSLRFLSGFQVRDEMWSCTCSMWGRSDFNFDQVALGVEHGHAETFDTATFASAGRRAISASGLIPFIAQMRPLPATR